MDGELLLATYRGVPDGLPWDGALAKELQSRGIRARAQPWDTADPEAGWAGVVLRTTWDYTQRFEEFLAWLGKLEAARVPTWNPPAAVRWNAHKSYLRDLGAKGIAIPDTAWVEAGSPVALADLQRDRGWPDVVVKPAVSCDARDTRRIRGASAQDAAWFHELVASRDVLVQPFLPQVAQGEWAFVFFAGRFSHAVLKRPAVGDWRVQPRLGGTAQAVEATPEQLDFARAVLEAAPESLYARVDAVWSGGRPLLMELELIEPYLYLDLVPQAAARFADAIAGRM